MDNKKKSVTFDVLGVSFLVFGSSPVVFNSANRYFLSEEPGLRQTIDSYDGLTYDINDFREARLALSKLDSYSGDIENVKGYLLRHEDDLERQREHLLFLNPKVQKYVDCRSNTSTTGFLGILGLVLGLSFFGLGVKSRIQHSSL
ncbi:MAG: hypothetical protein AABX23_01710 [Nanoarchaeota archaeon]